MVPLFTVVTQGNVSNETTAVVMVTNSSMIGRTVVLAFITIVGFISNLILIVTVLLSASLRAVHINKHIVSISIINILTCILGMPMTIGYSVTENWDYGDLMCNLLSYIIYLICIGMSLSVLALNFDRIIAVHRPDLYNSRMTSVRTILLIVLVWLAAILFPLPLALDLYRSTSYRHRYLCSIAPGSSLKYLEALYIVCFALPGIGNLLSFLYVARRAISERESHQTVAEATDTSSGLWTEVKGAGLALALFILWLLCDVPFITLSSVEQYRQSAEQTLSIDYPSDLDTVFTWLKFSNCLVLPFAVFTWRKDVWNKFKDLMFCRKSNSVVDATLKVEKTDNFQAAARAKKLQKQRFPANFEVPTIYAAREGLHVRGNIEDADDHIFYADMDITGRTKENGLFLPHPSPGLSKTIKLEGDDGDTSDYETDRYSRSDPISVRSDSSQPQHVRAWSHDEDAKAFRSKTGSISADSGNSSAPNSMNKRERKNRRQADNSVKEVSDVTSSALELCTGFPSSTLVTSADVYDPSYRQSKSYGPYMFDKCAANKNLISTNFISVDETTFTSITKTKEESPQIIHSQRQSVLNEEEKNIGECQTSKRKGRKKNYKVDIREVATNTTLTTPLPSEELRPPARLKPLDSQSITNPLGRMNTPPLRNKIYISQTTSSDSQEKISRPSPSSTKSIAEEPPAAVIQCEGEALQSPATSGNNKRKKKRKKSGDSNKPLMSSNNSAENQTIVNQAIQESHI